MWWTNYGDRNYGDVVDGARLRHLMCHDGSVLMSPNKGAIHHDEDYHKERNEQDHHCWP